MPRRLEDLYQRETDAVISDPGHEDIPLWLVKPDPVQQDTIVRKAGAAQAAVLAAQFHEGDEEWAVMQAAAMETDYETILTFMVDEFRMKRQAIIIHRVALSEEWAKEDYLQGLQTKWDDDLAMKPDDPDYRRVRAELDRFDAEVKEQLDAEVEYHLRDLRSKPSEEIFHEEAKRRLRNTALTRWSQTYNDWTLYIAVREAEDHEKQYFNDVSGVQRLDPRVKGALIDQYKKMVVDVTEGKELPGEPGSSPSSDPVAQEETSDSSGLVEAAA
jgi:hypothetical protein